MDDTAAGASVRDNASSARRNWQRTALRVRSMTRFRLLRRWSQPSSGREEEPPRVPIAVSLAAYERLGVLGVGGAAVVYLVRHVASQQLYPMKVQSCPMQHPWPRRTFHACKEQYILQMLHHPFVCRLHEAFHDSKRLYLILDYHHGGSLADVQAFCGGMLSEQAVRFYASEIVQALEYVHTMGFVYRDLKPQNVLVAADGHIRLTDFGVAHEGFPVDPTRYYTLDDSSPWKESLDHTKVTSCEDDATTTTATTSSISGDDIALSEDDVEGAEQDDLDDSCTDNWELDASSDLVETGRLGVDDRVRLRSNSFVGTVEYMPPEMIQQTVTQSSDVDWWALGCLMYELLYGVSPFHKPGETSTKHLFRRILVGKLEFPASPRVSDACKDVIRQLLRVDSRRRMGHRQGSSEVKAHPFFREIPWAYRSSDAPIRVQDVCLHSLKRQLVELSGNPPFLKDVDSDGDDLEWLIWSQSTDCETPCSPCCSHTSERYALPSPPIGRFEAFVRSQSQRFASFRSRKTSVVLARSDSML